MDIRKKIIDVLHEHKEGLLPTKILDKPEFRGIPLSEIRDTMQQMVESKDLVLDDDWRLQLPKESTSPTSDFRDIDHDG